jgi:hypothetical protein
VFARLDDRVVRPLALLALVLLARLLGLGLHLRDEAIAAASKPMTLKRRGKPPKAGPAITAPPA